MISERQRTSTFKLHNNFSNHDCSLKPQKNMRSLIHIHCFLPVFIENYPVVKIDWKMSPLFFVIFFLAAVGYANGMFKKVEM